jgi:pimeloyl-ACP methyl ester carboxylesterase
MAVKHMSDQENYKPPVVISIHGIRTDARWQKSLSDTLALHGIMHKTRDFGNYRLHRFLQRRSREKKVDEFYDFYSSVLNNKGYNIDLADYRSRPSIIAHSFGTYIVAYAMQKYSDIKFDKIIFCGSILPADFDWSALIQRDQINFVRNEHSSRDIWTSIVGKVIADAGNSGTHGFRSLSRVISQDSFEYFGHSDYFHERHIESYWIPVLEREPSPLQVRHGRTIPNDSFVATLNATAAIDDLCYAGLPGYNESKIPRGLSSTWIEINPDIYTFLFDRRNDKVCGYVNAIPVSDECFKKIRAGEIRDNEITSDDIVPFFSNQTMKLYLMSISIEPDLRLANQGLLQEPFERLIGGFISKLHYYAIHHRICVTELVSVGWTKSGRKLCEAFGMVSKEGEVDKDNNPIYVLDFKSGPVETARSIFPSLQILSETYKRMGRAGRSLIKFRPKRRR